MMNKKLLNIIRNYNPCRPCDNDKVVRIPIQKSTIQKPPTPTTKNVKPIR